MSISILQEEVKFRPVTIVIDNEATLQLLRFILDEHMKDYTPSQITGMVYKVEDLDSAKFASKELDELRNKLVEMCVVKF